MESRLCNVVTSCKLCKYSIYKHTGIPTQCLVLIKTAKIHENNIIVHSWQKGSDMIPGVNIIRGKASVNGAAGSGSGLSPSDGLLWGGAP